jgi:hypothetical protein
LICEADRQKKERDKIALEKEGKTSEAQKMK